MNPTLNSPKYADPKSLAFQMYKKQQDRKQRINPYVPQLEQRYFRRNEGTTDYATHSSVTVDRIVMDVNPSAGNGNTGLPTGAPAVTDNVMQTIDFVYSGTISELYRNGSDYFSGIIANVKYYLSGELIHSWSINSNSSTESDSVGGLLLTFINGNAADWGLFDRQADGDWLGQELSTSISPLITTPIGGPAVTTYQVAPTLALTYQIAVKVQQYQGSNTLGFIGSGAAAGVGSDLRLSENGDIRGEITATGPSNIQLFNRDVNQCTFDNISVKEVLKNA